MTTTLTSYDERSRERPDAMRRRAEASNTALERTVGSHSLAAAAAHRQRWADQDAMAMTRQEGRFGLR
jgi:hypothetical protein